MQFHIFGQVSVVVQLFFVRSQCRAERIRRRCNLQHVTGNDGNESFDVAISKFVSAIWLKACAVWPGSENSHVSQMGLVRSKRAKLSKLFRLAGKMRFRPVMVVCVGHSATAWVRKVGQRVVVVSPDSHVKGRFALRDIFTPRIRRDMLIQCCVISKRTPLHARAEVTMIRRPSLPIRLKTAIVWPWNFSTIAIRCADVNSQSDITMFEVYILCDIAPKPENSDCTMERSAVAR